MQEIPLEYEFKKRIELHKYQVILYTLHYFADRGIYNCSIIRNNTSRVNYKENRDDKAIRLAEELRRKCRNGEQELYNQVYEFCWKKVVSDDDNDNDLEIDNDFFMDEVREDYEKEHSK